ncbi:serine hydrolase [Luteibacter yeojuensis]
MPFRLPALALLLWTIATTAAAEGVTPDATQARMDRVFQRLGAEFVATGHTDGMSIAVVKDGKAHFYNFGTTSRGEERPPTEASVYEIGSVSKLFNSLVLAHAVLEHRIDPQADIRRYLPGDYPGLEWDGTPVRVIDLATTTSALPDNLPNPFPVGADPDKAPFIATQAMERIGPNQVFDELRTVKLSRKPGTVPQHSNLAPDLLGRILERIYGEPYEALVARYIEQPLGMQPGTGKARASAEVDGYNKRHVAMPRMYERAFLMAGGLRYSPTDMAKFLTAELAATAPAIRLTQAPAWGNPDTFAVGYNWTLSRTIDGKPRLRTSGSTFGCSSYIELYPALGYGIILLANRPGETQNEMQALANQALLEIWGKPPAQVALEQALDADGYRNVSRVVTAIKRKHPELHLTEDYVNTWAYRLLGEGKAQQAIGLFRYNTGQWPASWNAFDSLAEGYEKLGDKQNAIANYRKSLALNPDNRHGAEHLQALQAK